MELIYYNIPVELFVGLMDDYKSTLYGVEQYIIAMEAAYCFDSANDKSMVESYVESINYYNWTLDQWEDSEFRKTYDKYWMMAYDNFYHTGYNVRKEWEADYHLWVAEMEKRDMRRVVVKSHSDYTYALDLYWQKRREPYWESVKRKLKYPTLEVPPIETEAKLVNGLNLYLEYQFQKKDAAKVGIRHSDLMRLRNASKTYFDLACFLFFIAVKSIIGPDKCKPITNLFIFSRMDGYNKCLDSEHQLSDRIRKFYTRHYIDKIRLELDDHWHLRYYGPHMRGCYYSIKMSYESLVRYVETHRADTVVGKMKIQSTNRKQQIAAAKKAFREEQKKESRTR